MQACSFWSLLATSIFIIFQILRKVRKKLLKNGIYCVKLKYLLRMKNWDIFQVMLFCGFYEILGFLRISKDTFFKVCSYKVFQSIRRTTAYFSFKSKIPSENLAERFIWKMLERQSLMLSGYDRSDGRNRDH